MLVRRDCYTIGLRDTREEPEDEGQSIDQTACGARRPHHVPRGFEFSSFVPPGCVNTEVGETRTEHSNSCKKREGCLLVLRTSQPPYQFRGLHRSAGFQRRSFSIKGSALVIHPTGRKPAIYLFVLPAKRSHAAAVQVPSNGRPALLLKVGLVPLFLSTCTSASEQLPTLSFGLACHTNTRRSRGWTL